MPTKPRITTNTNISADVVNAIKNSASNNYRENVPYATPDADSLRGIGAILMNNPALMNEFINTLVNRIAFARIASRMYTNPLRTLKKGVIDTGETIEDIFVNIANVYQYEEVRGSDNGAGNTFKRFDNDVRVAFYVMNSQLTYPVTVNRAMLKNAFNSWAGMNELVSGIIQSVYSAAAYDEFNITKYMIGQHILKGKLTYYTFTGGRYLEAATQLRKASNDMSFMTDRLSIAGVKTFTENDRKVILINTNYDANIDTNVLAGAFNLPYADYLNRRILIDSLGTLDVERLDKIFANDPTYEEPSTDDMAFLDNIAGVILDEDFVQIYDNVFEMRDMPNPVSLDHNYFLHMWQTYAVSPFANVVCCIPAESVPAQTAENTTITPSAVDVTGKIGKDGTATGILTATVSTVTGGTETVKWTKTGGSATGTVASNGVWKAETTGTLQAKASIGTIASDTVTITIS